MRGTPSPHCPLAFYICLCIICLYLIKHSLCCPNEKLEYIANKECKSAEAKCFCVKTKVKVRVSIPLASLNGPAI